MGLVVCMGVGCGGEGVEGGGYGNVFWYGVLWNCGGVVFDVVLKLKGEWRIGCVLYGGNWLNG